jgi:ATP-dependent DNA helicase RecQ
VKSVKENFKAEHILDVLLGRETTEVLAHRHNELECFGCGDEHEERFWNAVIRQALIAGYIEKEIENYGILKLTSKAVDFIKKNEVFLVSEDKEFYEEEEVDLMGVIGGTSVSDLPLYNALKDLRKKKSKEYNVPPYVIFQEPSLEAMATVYPIDIEELKNIPGVGEGKAKRYGQEFCDLIKKYCEENDIERPELLRVRTTPKKSAQKLSIIQSIDRKISLDDIAASKGLEFEELLDELEAIVYSGTKLNIDYYLEDELDDDQIQDVYEYFREAESDNMDDALDELGSEYSEDDIRLIRIKFISELAN